MTGRDLMMAIGEIDDRFIDEAGPAQDLSRKNLPASLSFRGLSPVLTALCLIMAIAAIALFVDNQWFEAGGDGFGLETGPEQSSAIYRDLDISRIIYGSVEAKVPAEFWFEIRLAGAQLNKTGFLAKWDEQAKFGQADIETRLGIVVKEPALPAGDYTTAGSVLRDVRTDQVIAYRIDYIYFDPVTLDFLNSFRLFYFDARSFDPDRITATQIVTLQNGEPRIDELTPPTEAYGKVPHVRSLLFLTNGAGVAIEAQANFVAAGKAIDQQKTLELYKQTDRQLVGMMRSLID